MRPFLFLSSLLFLALLHIVNGNFCARCEALASSVSADACEEQCREDWPTFDCRFICQQLLRRSNLSPTVACQRLGLCEKEATYSAPSLAQPIFTEQKHDEVDWRQQWQQLIAENMAQPRVNREDASWLASERAALENAQRRLDDERSKLYEARETLEVRARDLDARAYAIDKQRSELTSILKDIVALKEAALRDPPPTVEAPRPAAHTPDELKPSKQSPPTHIQTQSPAPTSHQQTQQPQQQQPASHHHHVLPQALPSAHHEEVQPSFAAKPAYAEWALFWASAAVGLLCAIGVDLMLVPKLETDLNNSFEDERKMNSIMFQISLMNVVMPSLLVVAAYVGYLRPEGFADTFFLYAYLGLTLGKTLLDLFFRAKGFAWPLQRRTPELWLYSSMGLTVILLLYYGRTHPWLVAHFLLVRHIGDWINGMYPILGLSSVPGLQLDRFTAARSLVQSLLVFVWWMELDPSPFPWLLTSYTLLSLACAALDVFELVQSIIRKLK